MRVTTAGDDTVAMDPAPVTAGDDTVAMDPAPVVYGPRKPDGTLDSKTPMNVQ